MKKTNYCRAQNSTRITQITRIKGNRMKKRDNILQQADICDAREALHKSPKLDVIYLTPGEFKSVYAAFKKMENEIKELRRELQWERLDNKYLSEMLKSARVVNNSCTCDQLEQEAE